jgi:hypothetical protein
MAVQCGSAVPSSASQLRCGSAFRVLARNAACMHCHSALCTRGFLSCWLHGCSSACVRACTCMLAREEFLCTPAGTSHRGMHACSSACTRCCAVQELESVLDKRQAEFDIESAAKVVWMMGRAHHTSAAACAFVDTLASRADAPEASLRVRSARMHTRIRGAHVRALDAHTRPAAALHIRYEPTHCTSTRSRRSAHLL